MIHSTLQFFNMHDSPPIKPFHLLQIATGQVKNKPKKKEKKKEERTVQSNGQSPGQNNCSSFHPYINKKKKNSYSTIIESYNLTGYTLQRYKKKRKGKSTQISQSTLCANKGVNNIICLRSSPLISEQQKWQHVYNVSTSSLNGVQVCDKQLNTL